MELSTVLEFIQQTYLILVAVLFVIGYVIKQTRQIPDEWIPLILVIGGGVLGALLGMQTDITLFDSIMQGILCGGGAIATNQIPKQLSKLK